MTVTDLKVSLDCYEAWEHSMHSGNYTNCSNSVFFVQALMQACVFARFIMRSL